MTRFIGLAVLINLLLLPMACTTPFLTPADEEDVWTLEGAGLFRFRNNDFEVELRLEANRTWRWRITNHTLVAMTVNPKTTHLYREGDATAYTLYGQPVNAKLSLPDITIKPGRFYSVTYPIQFSSPLYPLPLNEGKLWLDLEVSWGGRWEPYRLVFPGQAED